MLDQRQYRDDQPCDDAVTPALRRAGDQPRDLLGRKQMNWAKQQLSSSKAAWKVVGNEVMMMPAKVLGGSYYTFDSWQGYQTEREELLGHIKAEGDRRRRLRHGRHPHVHRRRRAHATTARARRSRLEFVGGSITSQSLGETNLDAGGGVTIPGNDADPNTPQALIDALRGINPWVDQADFDHHGYGLAKVSRKAFDVTLKRVSTIKDKTTATRDDRRLPLPRRARAEVDQGRQRPRRLERHGLRLHAALGEGRVGGDGDRQVLDRQAGRVEERDRVGVRGGRARRRPGRRRGR